MPLQGVGARKRLFGDRPALFWPSWQSKPHDLGVKSKVHPKYKTRYGIENWAEYDRALVQRGDVTLWLTPEAIATWSAAGAGKRSGQLQYSDLAIETALTLSLIFHLPLRQTEGFLTSIFGMLGVDLTAPGGPGDFHPPRHTSSRCSRAHRLIIRLIVRRPL